MALASPASVVEAGVRSKSSEIRGIQTANPRYVGGGSDVLAMDVVWIHSALASYTKRKILLKMKFSELGLAEPFLRATDALGYEEATPIQAQAIPVVLSGKDLVGCAQTGTGKTAAFTLPMLDRLLQTLPPKPERSHEPKPKRKGPKGATPNPRTVRALVLSPTRELAAQISDSLQRYGKHTPLRHTVVFGGVSQFNQVRALRHGVDTIVATPGRLLDLQNQGHIDLSKVDILVLDEADQMLDMGFLPDLKRIVSLVPEKRQTLMFSATMPPAIRQLADQWLSDPETIEVAPVATPADRIAQSVQMVSKQEKPDVLVKFLKETPRSRTLVFSRTKHGADKIVKRLTRDGVKAAAIHGNKSQGARTRTLEQFKGKNPPVLVATDIAARGLDVRDVTHIVNYDLPDTPETYVHRIGRTARAGAEGVAVSFCAHDERRLLYAIERLMNCQIDVHDENGQIVELARPQRRQDNSRHDDSPNRRASKGGRPKRKRPFRKSDQGSESGNARPSRFRGNSDSESNSNSEYNSNSNSEYKSKSGYKSKPKSDFKPKSNYKSSYNSNSNSNANSEGGSGSSEGSSSEGRWQRGGKPGGKPGGKFGGKFKPKAKTGGKSWGNKGKSEGQSAGQSAGQSTGQAGGRPGGKPSGKPGGKPGAKAGGKSWGSNKGKFKAKGRKTQASAN